VGAEIVELDNEVRGAIGGVDLVGAAARLDEGVDLGKG